MSINRTNSAVSPTHHRNSETTTVHRRIACGVLVLSALCCLIGMTTSAALAFTLASCLAGCGVILLAFNYSGQSLRPHSSAIFIFAWLMVTGVSVWGFTMHSRRSDPVSTASGLWMAFAAIGALLFITGRVVQAFVGSRHSVIQLIREMSAVSLIIAFATASTNRQGSVPAYFATLSVQLWSLANSIEGLLRLIMAVVSGRSAADGLSSTFLCRQLLLETSLPDSRPPDFSERHPIDAEDATQGASGRTSFLVGIVLTLLAGWLFSGLVIVRTGDRAACFRLGVLQPEILQPGIHLTLPFPFSRTTSFSAEKLRATTIGYMADTRNLATQPMLWTKPHGDAEFPLIVGDGTELVAINAVVHYRTGPSDADLFAYATAARDHDTVLRNLAQHVLIQETRTVSLQGLLSMDRSAWGRHVRSRLQDQVDQLKLGLDVIQFDILSIHPPIEVAESFLDIVTARVDAEREITEARGAHLAERSRCEMMAATDVADATAAASVRLTAVMHEALQLTSLADVDEKHSAVFRRRAFCDNIAEALTDRTVTFIDRRLPSDMKLWLGSQREIHPETAR